MTLEEILSRLDGVKGGNGQYSARCPAHDDHHASLSISIGKDGKILLNCFAGCEKANIVDALGLTMKDLFPNSTPEQAFPSREIVATYRYINADGELIGEKLRRADKSFTWRYPVGNGWDYHKPKNIVPYNLPQVLKPENEIVFLVEGEKDVDSMCSIGLTATCSPDGAGKGKWRKDFTKWFKGKHVFIIQDNDDVGKAYAQEEAASIKDVARSVKVLDLAEIWPGLPKGGDASDLIHHIGADQAKHAISELAVSAPEWTPEQAASKFLTPMSNVEAKRASYLISPYLPRGMLAIMGGISGVGKTYLVLSWAAAISNGQRLPFQPYFEPAPPSGYVYYFTQENDPNTVIRPRLDTLGANLDKILIQAQNGTTYDQLTLNDPRLEEAAKIYPPSMIIFDPIQSYLGTGVEMNKANEVRPILDWLGDYAKRHMCTVVLVSHMSKPGVGNSSALDRLLGSSDFRNAARSIIVVGRDPENTDSRVFAHGKNSIGPPGPSQRYHIDGAKGVVYDGECNLTADDIVKQGQPGARAKPAITLTRARQMLEELLGVNGYATLEQVETLQEQAGISDRTLYRARNELAVQSVSIGQPPNRKTWVLLPEIDVDKFKLEHTPPPEQLKLKTNFAK